MLLLLSSIAAVASVLGAVFAIWRWNYALKAYRLQRLQTTLRILMLVESREYWRTPKMLYVADKKNHEFSPSLKEILKDAEKAGLCLI